ncbi:MAG: serine/threonine-protein kinase [Mycobacteriaceae bacterium]
MSLNAGAMLADRYRLANLIAVGGMGEVWEAMDTRLNRRVAVKVLKPEISSDPEFLERFRVEARTAAALNHPGIAGVYDYGETEALDDGARHTAYLVMERVDGEPLSAVLAREGRLDLDQALDMLEQTARALQAAHSRGTVHRDVKPGNILITPTGQVKITDFGIAKAADSAPVTRTGMVVGTAQYIAPEQALGREATPASDVYALGVVGHEAISGARPFVADNPLSVAMMHINVEPPELPADVPMNVRILLESAMAKDPTQRYANGGEFADAIAAVRTGRQPLRPAGWLGTSTAAIAATRQQVAPTPVGSAVNEDGAEHENRRNKTALLWFLGVLLVGLLALGGYALLSSRGDSPTMQTPTPLTQTTAPATQTTTPRTTTTTTTVTTTTTRPPLTTTTTAAPPTTTPTTTKAPTTTTTPAPTTTTTTPPTTAPTTTATAAIQPTVTP